MNKLNKLIALFCIFLVISTTFVYSRGLSPQTNTQPQTAISNQGIDPSFGRNLGGFAYPSLHNTPYRDPYAEQIRQTAGGFASSQDLYLGEAIIINVADYQPRLVRQSALEQQDLPVYVKLKGTTVGTLLSPFTDDPSAKDPLSGITSIPPIDFIDVTLNASSDYSKYVRFVRYLRPNPERYSLNNLGSMYVFLRKLDSEDALPPDNTIVLDLNARIYLKLQESNLLGISQQNLALKQFPNEEEFFRNKEDYSFFSNKGFVRSTRIGQDSATLLVYNRDLRPISLASSPFSSQAALQGLRSPVPITLTRNQVSPPVYFGYTGNPLNDMFQIRLDDVSTPANKAEIEFQIDGRTITKKVSENKELYAGSNWILKTVSTQDTGRTVDSANINQVAAEFDLKDQVKNRLISKINQVGNLQIWRHVITLENKLTQETKIITREIISEGSGQQTEINIDPISSDFAVFLEEKYCFEENPEVDKGDFACTAVLKYKTLIRDYPSSQEAKKAKRDLAEIYDKHLIDFKSCRKKADGTALDENKCKEFRLDMLDLAHFYYAQIGEEKTIVSKYGGRGGSSFLDDEGVALTLIRVIKLEEEKSAINLRIYTDTNDYNEVQNIKEGNVVNFQKPISYRDSEDYVWKVSSISTDSATLRLYKKEADKFTTTNAQPVTLKINELKQVTTLFPETDTSGNPVRPEEITNVMLTKIDSKYEAYITILPGAGRAFTTSTFRVHIPVDPRPFKLAPEQMQSHIKTTQEIIDKLNEVIEKLDKVISTMKKLCLGVFALLTIKNSFTGARNIARKQVAESFKIRCEKESLENPDKFPTIDRCLDEYSDEITASVDKTEKYIDDINSKIKRKSIEELKLDPSFGSTQERAICGEFNKFAEASQALGIKNEDTIKKYRDCLLYAKIQIDTSIDTNYQQFIISRLSQVNTKNTVSLYDQARAFAQQNYPQDSNNPERIRRIIAQFENENQEVLTNIKVVDIELENKNPGQWLGKAIIRDTPTTHKVLVLRGLSKYDHIIYREKLSSDEQVKKYVCENHLTNAQWTGSNCVEKDRPARSRADQLNRKIQELKVQEAQEGPYHKFVRNDYYGLANGFHTDLTESECKSVGGTWRGIAGTSFFEKCEPVYYSSSSILDTAGRQISPSYSEDPIPAYYRNDGLPYCYPVGDGNYALVQERFEGPNSLINKIAVYNVGPNGRIECAAGDDELIHLADKLDVLTDQKSRYISKEPRVRCEQKDDGKKKVGSIDGKDVICKVGLQGDQYNTLLKPKCIDVMDPADCKWMFNFCDPVMCPSSRCNLGGRVPERNVIQSGLVGSTLLCLPNIKEGIVMPVCLTGISAGLKNIRSILEGYKQCLEIKLSQNENVGFCDYIRSVGICELVWKESYNLLNIGGRGLIDWVSGNVFGEPKGGGEYLTFQSSLNNVGESVRIFTEEYKTTYTAQFLSQSTDEIGTQICRLSINGKLPNVGKILDQLTEPENPPQFTAFFDETPYAATGEAFPAPNIPGGTQEESLYKVFYHIYAGTGFYQGSFTQPQSLFNPQLQFGPPQLITYSVFLRNEQAGYLPLYVTFPGEFTQTIGTIEPGKFQQQSVQKRGIKGYNEICVVINGIPQCGFGKVGSSFGLQELNDLLVGNEAEKQIDSAEECTPDSRRSQQYSIAKLGALGAAQLAGGGTPIGVVTSDIDRSLTTTGIIRVCSVEQPTTQTGRWREVGTCGEDERGKVLGSCWLDLESVSIQDRKINEELHTELLSRAEERFKPIDAERARSILTSINEQRNTILEQIRALVKEKTQSKIASTTRIIIAPPPVTPPTPSTYDELFIKYGTKHGIDPALFKAIARLESGLNHLLIGPAGEIGLIQLIFDVGIDYFDDDRIVNCCDISQAERNQKPILSCREENKKEGKVWKLGTSYKCTPDNDDRFNLDISLDKSAEYLDDKFANLRQFNFATEDDRIKIMIASHHMGSEGTKSCIKGRVINKIWPDSKCAQDISKTVLTWESFANNLPKVEYTGKGRTWQEVMNSYVNKIYSYYQTYKRDPRLVAEIDEASTPNCISKFKNQDFVAIKQDFTMACDENDKDLCCIRNDLILHIERIRKAAAEDSKVLVITDPARTKEEQRDSFLDYLGGGALACGPNTINKQERANLRSNAPQSNTKTERLNEVRNWLSQNEPQTLSKIDDLNSYNHCRHIKGQALDIRFDDSPRIGTELSDQDERKVKEFRNFMCENGWANLGEEWWHYEIGTSGYLEAKKNNKCYFNQVVGPQATATPDYRNA